MDLPMQHAAFPGQTRPSRTACFRLLLLIHLAPSLEHYMSAKQL